MRTLRTKEKFCSQVPRFIRNWWVLSVTNFVLQIIRIKLCWKCEQREAGRHDIQHNDTQHDDTQYNDTQHKGLICDTQHYDTQHNDIQHGIVGDTKQKWHSAYTTAYQYWVPLYSMWLCWLSWLFKCYAECHGATTINHQDITSSEFSTLEVAGSVLRCYFAMKQNGLT
jgi:hypothetical protein